MASPFKLQAPYVPKGDQPEAIKGLVAGVDGGERRQGLQLRLALGPLLAQAGRAFGGTGPREGGSGRSGEAGVGAQLHEARGFGARGGVFLGDRALAFAGAQAQVGAGGLGRHAHARRMPAGAGGVDARAGRIARGPAAAQNVDLPGRRQAGRPGTDSDRISVYAVGEGTVHAMTLADDTTAGAPKIHSLGLLQPVKGALIGYQWALKMHGFDPDKRVPDPALPVGEVRIGGFGGVDGLIVSNTTISRPALRSAQAHETGGLSGAPLRELAQQRLRDFRKATGGAVPLIGVGGIASAEDAWARIRAGASLVQLYSAMAYAGPGIARQITRGLEALMRRDGFASIAEAVGTE